MMLIITLIVVTALGGIIWSNLPKRDKPVAGEVLALKGASDNGATSRNGTSP